jgi:hypothetical protein
MHSTRGFDPGETIVRGTERRTLYNKPTFWSWNKRRALKDAEAAARAVHEVLFSPHAPLARCSRRVLMSPCAMPHGSAIKKRASIEARPAQPLQE